MADVAYPAPPLPEVADFFRTLADETRFAIIRILALSDRKAGELGSALQLPSNAVSYHLKQLRTLGLLHDHRSSADGRDVYYQLDVGRLAHLFAEAGDALHPGLGASVPQPAEGGETRAATALPQLRMLFLCTHNSARSQLAEALTRQMGGEYVEVDSAGSMPTEVHPDTITVLGELGIDPSPLHAKSLDQFVGEPFDYIITVCDRVRDMCPSFPGDPNQAHWSFADPVVIEDPEQRLKAFRQVAAELRTRIGYLLLLPHPRTGERFAPRRS
jgi:ArsR family transcriptional regulator, arsenate/arsenite/antimonite-responsive transcriptional repressor / arsenate reductase (thioredoxin)